MTTPTKVWLAPGGLMLSLHHLEDGTVAVVTRKSDEEGVFHPLATHIYEVGTHGAYVLVEEKVHSAP